MAFRANKIDVYSGSIGQVALHVHKQKGTEGEKYQTGNCDDGKSRRNNKVALNVHFGFGLKNTQYTEIKQNT